MYRVCQQIKNCKTNTLYIHNNIFFETIPTSSVLIKLFSNYLINNKGV